MLLSFLTFALIARHVQSSESSLRSQSLFLDEYQDPLHQEMMNPLLALSQQHFESPKSKMVATAISETATYLEGFASMVFYAGPDCQAAKLTVSVNTKLNYCINATTTPGRPYSFMYRATSTSEMKQAAFNDDICKTQVGVDNPLMSGCIPWLRGTSVLWLFYSSTLSLPTPPGPYLRRT